MSVATFHRDERTIAVENASYRWAYLVLSFGLLFLVAYRSLIHREQPWDLLALVVLGGVFSSVYQGFRKVLSPRWAAITVVTILIAAGLSIAIAALR